MKILLVADVESKALWDFWQPGRSGGPDLIISCGDLKASYLEFLVTMEGRPLFYVPGNHDSAYEKNPPEGCENIDDRLVNFNGLRILGLGGCMRYNPGPYQYTENEMSDRIRRLRFRLWRAKGADIIVTHAPVRGIGDASDPCHTGFECFKTLIDKYHPRYLVHGHMHQSYGHNIDREHEYHGTKIINTGERYLLEI